MLRKTADLRTLAYLAFASGLMVVQWRLGHVNPVLYALSLFMGITAAVISHNHNHLSIWKWRPLNLLTSYVISILYGHPAIAWVPTHNQVHHKLNNKPGDTSRSPKYFKGNHLLALLVYPTLTGIAQQAEIRAFFGSLRKRSTKAWLMAISEYVVFFGFMLFVFLLDWRKALLFVLIPQQFALFVIQVFNYVQHVEADEDSAWNHSRNFVSPVLNTLLFNNGLHTVPHAGRALVGDAGAARPARQQDPPVAAAGELVGLDVQDVHRPPLHRRDRATARCLDRVLTPFQFSPPPPPPVAVGAPQPRAIGGADGPRPGGTGSCTPQPAEARHGV
jgi:beta-carotene hydroxylase